jgi:hemoglobin
MSESAAEGIERRARLVAQIRAETGIDEAMIERLVHGFYDRVRADPVLGPVFAARIDDWAPHLARMCEFWSSVALMSGRYHGQPMPKHVTLPIEARHFDRWLGLFRQAAVELCPPAAAAHFVARAERIAQSIEMGVASQHGVILGKGERFVRGG